MAIVRPIYRIEYCMRQTSNATIIEKLLNNSVYPAMFLVSHAKGRRRTTLSCYCVRNRLESWQCRVRIQVHTEPTIVRVTLGLSGYVWLDTNVGLDKMSSVYLF